MLLCLNGKRSKGFPEYVEHGRQRCENIESYEQNKMGVTPTDRLLF